FAQVLQEGLEAKPGPWLGRRARRQKAYSGYLRRRLCLGGEGRSDQGNGASEKSAPVHLLNDLVRPRQHRGRDREAEGLRRLEVDDELELGGLLDGEVGRLGALEESVDVAGRAAMQVGKVRPIGHQPAAVDSFLDLVHRGQSSF